MVKTESGVLKVLFFIDSLRSGGKERRLTELMKLLNLRSDIHFELVVMSGDIHYQEVLDLGINIHYIIRKTKRDFSVFHSFYKLCRSYKPDIVHCWDSMTAIYSIPTCKLLNIRFVNGMVMISPEHLNILNKNWWRAKLTFPFSDTIVGNSRAGLIAYNSPQNKSRCIYNGFNFERIKSLNGSDIIKDQLKIKTRYLVGMVASFSEKKDYATYFSAAQLLLKRRNDITFLAIGSNTDSDNSKSHISVEFDTYFRLLGKKSDVESYVNAMDVCVLSTFTEGISNSILEYMALGKPVIGTDGGGTNEIVDDLKTGFLIRQANPEELAGKLAILLDNAELRAQMGMAGKDRIINFFSIDKMVNEYISLYKEAV